MAYIHCDYCGELRDTSGRYTSPRNALLDELQWEHDHESGACEQEDS